MSTAATVRKLERQVHSMFDREARIINHGMAALRARRKMRELGMTVEEVADRARLHRVTVLRYMHLIPSRPTKDPKFSTALRVARALGMGVYIQ